MPNNNTPCRPRQNSPSPEPHRMHPINASPNSSSAPRQERIPPDNQVRSTDQSNVGLYSMSLSLQPISSSNHPPIPAFFLPSSVHNTLLALPPPMSPFSSPSSSLGTQPSHSSQSLDAHLFGTNTQGQRVRETHADTLEHAIDEHADVGNSSLLEAASCPVSDALEVEEQKVQSTHFKSAVNSAEHHTSEYSRAPVVAHANNVCGIENRSSASARGTYPSGSNDRKRSLPLPDDSEEQVEIGTNEISVGFVANHNASSGAPQNPECPHPRKKLCNNSRGKCSIDQL